MEKILENGLKEEIEKVSDVTLEINKDFKSLTTIKLKAIGTLIVVGSIDSLKKILTLLNREEVPYRFLGMGANQIIAEKSRCIFIKLKLPFDKSCLEKQQEVYTLPASLNLGLLSQHAIKFSLKGWECFTGVPGTLGGAICMNAGTNFGEIKSIIKKVFLITKEGLEKEIVVDKNSFSYRKNNFLSEGDVIIGAEMFHNGQDKAVSEKIKNYLHLRNKTQPLDKSTSGCIFKNYSKTCRAGHYIDIIGLKGLSLKGICISHKHGNFFEHSGGSSQESVLKLIKAVKKELRLNYGIEFETEVELND